MLSSVKNFVQFRALFSSLLDAFPQKKWNLRDDAYACREADYIAEAEGSLLYTKRLMIVHLFEYYLRKKSGLSENRITEVSKLAIAIIIHFYCISSSTSSVTPGYEFI